MKEPRTVEIHRDGPIYELLVAMNHYISTGDHIGEGNALIDTSKPGPNRLGVVVPVDPKNSIDVRDFELLQLRLTEIAAENGPSVELENHGSMDRFDAWIMFVAEPLIPALTAALKAKPSAEGWGSVKLEVEAEEALQRIGPQPKQARQPWRQ